MNLNNKYNISRDRAQKDIHNMIQTWSDDQLDPNAAVTTLLAESLELVFEMSASPDDAFFAIQQLISEIEDHRNPDPKDFINELH